jgi:hypothetical protein
MAVSRMRSAIARFVRGAARDALTYGALIGWYALLAALALEVAFAFFPDVPAAPR